MPYPCPRPAGFYSFLACYWLLVLLLGTKAHAQSDEIERWGAGTYCYKQVGERSLRLHVMNPPKWSQTDARPALVFFHGGGWVAGSPWVFDWQREHFAKLGFVCITVEYRLVGRETLEPPFICIEDARSAMRWVRGRAGELGIDPHRIASVGASAGGHLAACIGMGVGNDAPQDDTDISPVSQAMILLNPVLHNGPGEYGFGHKRIGERFRQISPFHSVSAQAAPAIIFVGTEDPLVPVPMLREFADAMESAGVHCELRVYQGQGHSFFSVRNENGKYRAITVRAMEQFLRSIGWFDALT